MDFDERLIRKDHVIQAIEEYAKGEQTHRPARSAFLLHEGKRLPAKYLLRLAFRAATGEWARPEQLTGGRASVRVLRSLGFDAIYEKPAGRAERNTVKSARREALRLILQKRFGIVLREHRFDAIRVPDLMNRSAMQPDLRRVLEAVEACRGIQVKGKANLRLAFDFYLPEADLVLEFDERQHFTPLRAAALQAYPDAARLGFDPDRWIRLSGEIRAGDNSPAYRDEQRAFYDSLRDLGAPKAGLKPVVRIFEEDVAWEKTGDSSDNAADILNHIEAIAGYGVSAAYRAR